MDIRLVISLSLLIISIVISYSFMGSDIFLGMAVVNVGMLLTIIFLFGRRMVKRNLIRKYLADIKASKREMLINATVTKVENMIWKYSQVEDASLECEYTDQKGKVHIFKVSGIIGKVNVKVGDTVQVLVQPNKWSNYQILLNDIVD